MTRKEEGKIITELKKMDEVIELCKSNTIYVKYILVRDARNDLNMLKFE